MNEIPLHPMIVHFPIAFYILEAVLHIFGKIKKDPVFRRFAFFTFWAGYGMMLAAWITGYFEGGGLATILKHERLEDHFTAATTLLVFYTFRAGVWKAIKPASSADKWIHLTGALIGCVVVAVTGYFGGLLVYGSR
ncbi:MAG: hypothetical protein HYZ83_05640 [Candidatus Omnitrophica bacterium]|nr:hypothetical protein [Candidatus Omnitrophota bacterium]